MTKKNKQRPQNARKIDLADLAAAPPAAAFPPPRVQQQQQQRPKDAPPRLLEDAAIELDNKHQQQEEHPAFAPEAHPALRPGGADAVVAMMVPAGANNNNNNQDAAAALNVAAAIAAVLHDNDDDDSGDAALAPAAQPAVAQAQVDMTGMMIDKNSSSPAAAAAASEATTTTDAALPECSICTCEIEHDEVKIACSNKKDRHFIDAGCFAHLLSTLKADAQSIQFWAQHRALKCPMCCDHDSSSSSGGAVVAAGKFDEEQIFLSNDAALIREYVTVTRNIACSVEKIEAQRLAEKQALDNSEESKNNLVKSMLRTIEEKMTTSIACPHCKTVFFDFAGCLSLSCERCKKEFCGVCLQKHTATGTTDGHQQVAECMRNLPAEQVRAFDFHSTYFISAKGWDLWKEKLKVDALYDYLRTLRSEFVWESFHHIERKLTADQLLTRNDILALKKMVFSHKLGEGLHLVRLPNTFWLVYSAKKNVRFIDAVQNVQLTSMDLKSMGLAVIAAIRAAFPHWEAQKKMVPGETFESVNYPPEFLPRIATAIESWGVGRYW